MPKLRPINVLIEVEQFLGDIAEADFAAGKATQVTRLWREVGEVIDQMEDEEE